MLILQRARNAGRAGINGDADIKTCCDVIKYADPHTLPMIGKTSRNFVACPGTDSASDMG